MRILVHPAIPGPGKARLAFQIRRQGFAVLVNALSHFQVNRIDQARADAGQSGRITGRQFQGKGLQQTTKSGLTNPGIFIVPVYTIKHGSKRMLVYNLLPKTPRNIWRHWKYVLPASYPARTWTHQARYCVHL